MTYGRRASDLRGVHPFKQQLFIAFSASTLPIRIVTILIHLAITIGIILRGIAPVGPDADLDLLFSHLPWWVWALMTAYVFCARVIGTFIWVGFKITRRTTPIVACYVYVMLFISNCFSPPFGMALAYLVVVAIETWLLARAYTEDRFGIL